MPHTTPDAPRHAPPGPATDDSDAPTRADTPWIVAALAATALATALLWAVTGSRETLPDLAPGDVLSIDSSHILMPGTDVDILLNRVLPALPAGVLVHIHDVFLPDDYPPAWSWRGYNEQLGVAALVQGGG